MKDDLIFRGTHQYRTARTLTRFAPIAAISAVAIHWASRSMANWALSANCAPGTIVGFSTLGTAGLVLFAVSTVQLWHWVRGTEVVFEISASGVALGGRQWPWASVVSLEITAFGGDSKKCFFRLVVREALYKVYPFVADDELTSADVERLVQRASAATAEFAQRVELPFRGK